MSGENLLWGAPRIHGELFMLCVDVAQSAVFKNRLRTMGIRDRPISPDLPWQNGHMERLIGTIRRECLNHMLIIGARHLQRVLASYAAYYNQART